MQIIYQVLLILGSLGLFVYGMRVLSEGIQKAAGHRMKSILNFMTANRVAAVFTGFAVTVMVQSSSATTVMMVSFVNAGLMSLVQAIGVILGANIGTTVTGWIVAILGFRLEIYALAIPSIAIGFPLYFFKYSKYRNLGQIFIGFGIVFLGLAFLKDSVPDLQEHAEMVSFLAGFDPKNILNLLVFVLAGILITAVVQSSSAAMAIFLTMAYSGWISFPAAAALVLGQNIGTTVTVFFASIGATLSARRAAIAHILFNVLGTIWVIILFRPFLSLVDALVPGDAYITAHLPIHLAMYHSIFNVINAIIFLPFVQYFSMLVKRIVPGEEPVADIHTKYEFRYFTTYQDTPELYLLKARDETTRMAKIVLDMFSRYRVVYESPERDMGNEVGELKKIEEYSDQMQLELTKFLSDMVGDSMTEVSLENVNALLRIVNELESVADSTFNLVLLTEQKYNKEIFLHEEAHDQIVEYNHQVQEFINFIKDKLDRHISDDELAEAEEFEKKIDSTRNRLKEAAQVRIQNGSDVNSELCLIDYLKHLEHIGDYLINIAQALEHMH